MMYLEMIGNCGTNPSVFFVSRHVLLVCTSYLLCIQLLNALVYSPRSVELICAIIHALCFYKFEMGAAAVPNAGC